MQFNIDSDSGAALQGWIVPNNPSVIPRIRIAASGLEPREIDANVLRQDIKDLGLHMTGQVGFYLDDASVPGIAGLHDLQLVDCETGVLIHRRHGFGQALDRKVIFFNMLAMAQVRMFRPTEAHFNLTYSSVEKINFDTLFAVLNNQFTKSIFVTGRNNYPRVASVLANQNYTKFCLLREPLTELAERIIFLKFLLRSPKRRILEGLIFGFENLMALAEQIDGTDAHSLDAIFKNLKPAQIKAISDPFLRAIACEAGEEPELRHVSTALDILSTFDVVGTEERLDDFNVCVEECLGIDLFAGVSSDLLPGVLELRDKLEAMPVVVDLLQLDILLHQEVNNAVEGVFDASSFYP